jgi:hypothetical protein
LHDLVAVARRIGTRADKRNGFGFAQNAFEKFWAIAQML